MGAYHNGKRIFTGERPLAFPNVTFQSDHIKRVVNYNGVWYYELLMLKTGVLTVGERITCDIYLVGSGGRGAGAPWDSTTNITPSPGGGSGYENFSLNDVLLAADYGVRIEIGERTLITHSGSPLTAQCGGDANADINDSYVGDGYEGEYHLYGDLKLSGGFAGGAALGSGTSVYPVPGRGGGGCNFPDCPKYPDWGYTKATDENNRDWTPVKPYWSGFGAGAFGAITSSQDPAGYVFAGYNPNPVTGVVAIRIRR